MNQHERFIRKPIARRESNCQKRNIEQFLILHFQSMPTEVNSEVREGSGGECLEFGQHLWSPVK